MDDMHRRMLMATAGAIRIRLKVARDERWLRWAFASSGVVTAGLFSWRGDFGFAAFMLIAAFYYCSVVPRAEASGMRTGWTMAWTTVAAIIGDNDIGDDVRQQLVFAAQIQPSERLELERARLALLDIERRLKEDE